MAQLSDKNGLPKGTKTTGSTIKKNGGSHAWRVTKGIFAVIGRILSTVLLVGVITGCIVATVLSVYILRLVNTEDVIDLRNFKQNYTSIIYAEDPETGETYELQRLIGGENRIWVGIEKIPEHTRQAFIAIEDKRFDDKVDAAHSGVDWYRTAGVTMRYLTGQSQQGGSTITQQLIKNITGEADVTVTRKVQEIFRAINMEKVYSKDDILEAYLNTISLANNTNGIQAAANLYFGKDAGDLTITESACIASITKNPTAFNPFTAKGSVNNKERREYVLYEMHDQGRITDAQYEQALKESANLTFKKEEAMQQFDSTQSYFVDHVIEEVIADLVAQKGMSRAQATTKIYSGGYRIYSTINPRIQAILDEKYADDETFSYVTNKEPPQSAMVIMDTHGRVLGIAGGRGQKVSDRVFNYATMAKRQPGSSIKPISVYAQAIEYGLITYSSVFEDSPLTEVKNGDEVIDQWPSNHYRNPPYLGDMTIVTAIQRSTNTVAAKVCELLSPRRCFDFMKSKLGITTLIEAKEVNGQIKTDVGLAQLALGSLTEGVTVLEMTGAYQIFANGGTFTEPYSYTSVLDAATGEVVLENKQVSNKVISEDTAYIMNRLMHQVVNASPGTGMGARLQGAEVVGKTGTSDKDYNQWFIGATPNYVAGVWIGYDRNKRVTYSSYPPPNVWKRVMQEVVKLDENPGSFPVASNVVQRSYCTETGELATTLCPSTAIGYYSPNNLPNTCIKHLTGYTASDEHDEEYDDDNSDEWWNW